MLHNIEWQSIFSTLVQQIEQRMGLSLVIDEVILKEAGLHANQVLSRYELDKPNVAKVASALMFWVRKLKPIHHAEDTVGHYAAINELVSILLGLSICERYKDDRSLPGFHVSAIDARVLEDWIRSFRIHSHSPHSTVIAMELFATSREE